MTDHFVIFFDDTTNKTRSLNICRQIYRIEYLVDFSWIIIFFIFPRTIIVISSSLLDFLFLYVIVTLIVESSPRILANSTCIPLGLFA